MNFTMSLHLTAVCSISFIVCIRNECINLKMIISTYLTSALKMPYRFNLIHLMKKETQSDIYSQTIET